MKSSSRLEAVRADMKARGLEALIAINDGSHFSGSDDALFLLSGFRCLDESAFLVCADGADELVVTPPWDAGRGAERAPSAQVSAADDLAGGLASRLKRRQIDPSKIGVAGLATLPHGSAAAVASELGGKPVAADALVSAHAGVKSEEEIEHARTATRIAEKGWERMVELTRPGVREDELAVELNGYMRELGAEDNFFMLTSAPENRAVQPCSSRRFEKGDFVLTELSPLVSGQMTQICRTIYIGRASEEHKRAYALLKKGFEAGLNAAKPGAPMADVCNAVDAVLEAAGYAEYSAPPWLRLRRRGHGLGLGSNLPGDVGPDNDIRLEPGMLFVLHPNQYLPQTGYQMCGEPVLITAQGAVVLSGRRAELAEVSA
jgi:Xaa-Pro dipeptidase